MTIAKVQVTPEGTPPQKGSLSPGILAAGFLFTSGLAAIHPETREIVGSTVAEQTEQTLDNLAGVLAAAGLDFGDVVKATVHLTDVQRDFAAFDAVYRSRIPEPRPVRTTVGSVLARPGLLVEIDMVALAR